MDPKIEKYQQLKPIPEFDQPKMSILKNSQIKQPNQIHYLYPIATKKQGEKQDKKEARVNPRYNSAPKFRTPEKKQEHILKNSQEMHTYDRFQYHNSPQGNIQKVYFHSGNPHPPQQPTTPNYIKQTTPNYIKQAPTNKEPTLEMISNLNQTMKDLKIYLKGVHETQTKSLGREQKMITWFSSQIVNLQGTIKGFMMEVLNQKQIQKPNNYSQNFNYQMISDARYRRIVYANRPDLPPSDNLSQVCSQIFHLGFGLLHDNKLDSNKVKVFCSEKLLLWIIYNLASKNGQILSYDLNTRLKDKILPYFNKKYPLSEQAGENMQLSSTIIPRQNLDDNQNDFFARNGIIFREKPSANYDIEIMKWINQLVGTLKSKQDLTSLYQKTNCKQTLYERFQKDMIALFQKVESQSEINKIHNHQIVQDLTKFLIQASYPIPTPKNQQTNPHLFKESFEEYREKVRSYTSYKIGNKIKDNFCEFTQTQIKQGDFNPNDPGLIRILTKWSEELELCFDKKTTLERQQPFLMRNGSESFLQKKYVIILYKLLQEEKQNVDKYLTEAQAHLKEEQLKFSHRVISQIQARKDSCCSVEEEIVGKYSVFIFKNTQSYLKGYLNTLIHSICKALDKFAQIIKLSNRLNFPKKTLEEIEKMPVTEFYSEVINSRVKESKYKGEQQDPSSMVPQLITFKIADILRSKCSSKEKQILALYGEIERLNKQCPELFKIVRVKNKLNLGTKDILINILYHQKILVEIQLAIKSDKTKFIQDSTKFKHYLYEMQRSKFGPVQQMCNIWITKDPRAQHFLQAFESKNHRNYTQIMFQCWEELSRNNVQGQPIKFPFICDTCSYYYENPKISDKHCSYNLGNKLKICFFCTFEQKSALFDNRKDNIFYYQPSMQIESQIFIQQIPPKGFISNTRSLFEQGQEDQIIQYVKIVDKNMLYFFQKVNNAYTEFKQFNFDDKVSLKKFFTHNIIRSSIEPNQQNDSKSKIFDIVEQDLLIPRYLENCHKDEKNSLILGHKNLENLDVFDKFALQFSCVKRLNLEYNIIKDFSNISTWFKRLEILHISNNQIKQFPEEFHFDHLKRLDISHNYLDSLPSKCFTLPHLEIIQAKDNSIKKVQFPSKDNNSLKSLRIDHNSLDSLDQNIRYIKGIQALSMNHNQLKTLPTQIGELKNLKYLNFSKNPSIHKVPDFIEDLSNLESLEISFNLLNGVPENLMKAKKLKYLNLNHNCFKKFPSAIIQLLNLERLDLSYNQIQAIPPSIKKLSNLKQIIINNNSLKTRPKELLELPQLRSCFIDVDTITKNVTSSSKVQFKRQIKEVLQKKWPSGSSSNMQNIIGSSAVDPRVPFNYNNQVSTSTLRRTEITNRQVATSLLTGNEQYGSFFTGQRQHF